MGQIYVNPEGPNGKPDPAAAAKDIRETFYRMAMNDEETVALIAGGHTFGKTHGAGDPSLVGPEPEGSAIEEPRSSAGKASMATGVRGRCHHRRPGSHLVADANQVDNHFFDNLFKYEWELTKSPAGAYQWTSQGRRAPDRGSLRSVEEACADHVDDGPVASARPDLRKDISPLLREPRSVRRRVRSGVVQADASRHGPGHPLPRPACSEGDAELARPEFPPLIIR